MSDRDDNSSPRDPTPRLVFFDLDGTITRRDTLLPYVLAYALRSGWRLAAALGVLPTLLSFSLGRADHGLLKGALLHAALGNLERDTFDAWNRNYLPKVLRRDVFPDARRAIEAHRAAGDHLVLMTATVDLYADALGALLGFDEVISSRVRWSGDRLDGRLDGSNVRDFEKLRRLEAVATRFPERRIVAYGNSRPDLPHLERADEAVMVNATGQLRRDAERRRMRCVYWSI